MPRGTITKDYFKTLILQQKNKVYHEPYREEYKELVHKHLNELIDRLEEFRF
jgi:hypothetical protein